MSTAGQKKGIFGRVRRKQGSSLAAGVRNLPGSKRRVPVRPINVKSLLVSKSSVAIPKPGAAVPMLPEASFTNS